MAPRSCLVVSEAPQGHAANEKPFWSKGSLSLVSKRWDLWPDGDRYCNQVKCVVVAWQCAGRRACGRRHCTAVSHWALQRT